MRQPSRQDIRRAAKQRLRRAAEAAERARHDAEATARRLAAEAAERARRAAAETRAAELATIAAALAHSPEWVKEQCSGANIAAPGVIALRRMYGHSYFGSGGCTGRVRCIAFDGTERALRVVGASDNGFARGPGVVEIAPGEIIIARGGDCIGHDGRSWGETYACLASGRPV